MCDVFYLKLGYRCLVSLNVRVLFLGCCQIPVIHSMLYCIAEEPGGFIVRGVGLDVDILGVISGGEGISDDVVFPGDMTDVCSCFGYCGELSGLTAGCWIRK